jgi:ribosomal protein S18 acetylase RimI-like enzyme
MRKAILEARVAEAPQLTLSVDVRNRPAWELYRRLGFEPFEQREVFLAVWR